MRYESSEPDQSNPAAWEVIFLDRADADTKAAYEFLRPYVGDDKAEQWARDFFLAVFGLADFPGPFAYPIDEDATRLTGRPTRKMLFQGGTRRRPIGTPFRVYFYTVEAANESERSGIFIVRVLHGAAGSWPSS